MANEPIIELRNVSAERSNYQILESVSFALAEGETTVIMGGTGSGKSSLLKVAAGIVVVDKGQVLYRGKDLAKMSRTEELEFHRRSGFVFQDAALWANQSIFDNLALPIRFHEPHSTKAEVEKAVHQVVEIVGYTDDLRARPADLSTGERRLIGLARALVLDPELLFLDEPAAYLDDEAADHVYDIIAQLRARRRTLAIVTGNSEIAYRFADSLGVVGAGRLLGFGLYEDAVRWTNAALRNVMGRLKPRKRAGEGDSALDAWAEAFTASMEIPPKETKDTTPNEEKA